MYVVLINMGHLIIQCILFSRSFSIHKHQYEILSKNNFQFLVNLTNFVAVVDLQSIFSWNFHLKNICFKMSEIFNL